jgi:hypothetical protein
MRIKNSGLVSKTTNQSASLARIFSPFTDPFGILGQFFLTWRVKILTTRQFGECLKNNLMRIPG